MICHCSIALHPPVQRVVKSSCLTEHIPVSCRELGKGQSHSAWGKVQSILAIFYPLVVYSNFQIECFFFSFCFEILSRWTHTQAVFQPWLWRQQAERRLLIFLPKDIFALSLQTWVWLTLRYRAALSSTLVMKLTGLGRATRTSLWNVSQIWNDQSVMPTNWIHTDVEITN